MNDSERPDDEKKKMDILNNLHNSDEPVSPEPKPSAITPSMLANDVKASDEVSPEPPQMPDGFWPAVDYMLRHPDAIVEAIRRDQDLWRLARMFLLISLFMAGIYGGIMGATNLLQGSETTLNSKILQILITGIKVPVLFLLTLIIVLWPVYVSNAFMGAQLFFRQMVALLMATVAITVTVLASMATVAFFFSLTSRSYDFIKLLHVLFFVYAGLTGLFYLKGAVKKIGRRVTPKFLFVVWLLLYIFVGTQLAWVLRPFVGSPNEPFQIFRPRYGNFYESVVHSTRNILSDQLDDGKHSRRR